MGVQGHLKSLKNSGSGHPKGHFHFQFDIEGPSQSIGGTLLQGRDLCFNGFLFIFLAPEMIFLASVCLLCIELVGILPAVHR